MQHSPARSRSSRTAADLNVDAIPWQREGVAAGVLGAIVVAIFFALVDLARGRLLWTPFVLGSAFFTSRTPSADAPIALVLALGYTAIHACVFLAFGLTAAFAVFTEPVPRAGLRRGAVLACLLFVAFEITFAAFAQLFAPDVTRLLDAGRVAFANARAAAAMAGFLAWRRGRAG